MTSYSVYARRTVPTHTFERRVPSIQRLVNGISSGYEAVTNPAVIGALCKTTLSDCGGSSSGLGGMTKTDIVSSDDSSLASEAPAGEKAAWVIPHPVLLNNTPVPPAFMSCNTVPTSSTSPTPMFYDQVRGNINAAQRAPSTIGSNDLFVHVQTGETLSIVIGNDVQHINGPATVRMVNQAGMSPSALPLHVPPGHMVQQMVDEQGVLRHLILSPEATPTSRLIANGLPPPAAVAAPHGSGSATPLKPFVHGSPSPPVVPPYPPPAVPYHLHNNNEVVEENARKWIHHGKKYDANHLIHLPANGTDDHDQSQSGASANEEEEWERLTEMLSRMQPPQILRVAAKEADIDWQELDTSEASAPGGPFPQIDASEFTYEIVLFESVGRVVSSYRCEPGSGNRVRLCRLRPNTEYFVQLRASLEERGLQGSPSPAVKFRTQTAAPECPHPPRLVTRTHNSVTVSWRPVPDNGSEITSYRLEITKESQSSDEQEHYETAYEGLAEQTKVKGLTPSTRYRVRLIAVNSDGDSQPSAAVTLTTLPQSHLPKVPQCPRLASLSSRSVKLSWNTLPQHSYTLEMSDARTNNYSVVCERAQQPSAVINDLASGHMYQFRLIAHNEAGNSGPSEALIVRTPSTPQSSPEPPPPVPNRPHVISNGAKLEIGWRIGRTNNKDSIGFIVEGSCDEKNWCVVYKGAATDVQIRDAELKAFRVSAFRKSLQSAWSEILRVKREEKKAVYVPGQCAAPTITEPSVGCLRAQWNPPEGAVPPIIYQLHRVNLQPSSIIYQGEATMFDVTNCAPGEEIEVQVRAVALGSDGTRKEGEWSRVAVGRTAAQPPPPPTDVHVDGSNVLHWSPPATTNGAPITTYIIERTLVRSASTAVNDAENGETTSESGWTNRCEDASVHSLSVAEGQPGCKYQLCVSAVNSGGTSVPSECIYMSIPARAPSSPPSFHVLPRGCRQLQASWRAPFCNGSELQEYSLRVLDDATGEEVRLIQQPASSCECTIDSLEPDHTYRLSVCGINNIGMGEPSWATAVTLAPPPLPPSIFCSEAGPNYLKLKWKPPGNNAVTSSANYYYYLEKENDNGRFSPIYEGDSRYTKVRNLNESTKYRFRIRCSSRVSGAGPWSTPFEFTTEQLPPPTIRAAPTVTEVASGSFQVEWPPVRGATISNKETLLYRLQLASRTSNDRTNSTWKTIYEGVSTSYSLSTSESVQLRVQCVRMRDGVESVSSPSAIQFATPSVALASHKKTQEAEDEDLILMEEPGSVDWIRYHVFSDKHYALVILLLFVVLAFIVAVGLNAYFQTRA